MEPLVVAAETDSKRQATLAPLAYLIPYVLRYKGLVAATLGIAALSMSVWAHHMYATGQVLLPFFSLLTFLIGVPTGMKFFT